MRTTTRTGTRARRTRGGRRAEPLLGRIGWTGCESSVIWLCFLPVPVGTLTLAVCSPSQRLPKSR